MTKKEKIKMLPVVFAYIGYALLAATVAYTFYMMSRGAAEQDSMKPSSMDDFNITTADEGSKVPLTYGTRKITGNNCYYGRLRTEEIKEEVGSGKSKQDVVVGHKYFMDVWLSLGHGPLTVSDYYINEDIVDGEDVVLEYRNMTFSNGAIGNGIVVPDRCGETGLTLPGVAWVYFERLYIGDNATSLPTMHFVTTRIPAGLPLSNVTVGTGGVNPAAVVLDLLYRSGAGAGDINLTSFQTASTYWFNKGYGLHIVFREGVKCRDAIKKVLNSVGGSITQDTAGKFYLIAFNEADTSVATLDFDNGDIRNFTFQRPMWDVLYTDFVASFIDRTKDYSRRTVKAYNPALHRILGRKVEQSIDLTSFADLSVASKRIWDIMKENTYPAAQITCEVPFKFSDILVGQVVNINYSRFGISNALFRLMEKDVKSLNENFLRFGLRQMTEKIYDSSWATAGGSSWTTPNYTPGVLARTKVWQMPFNHFTGTGNYDNGFYAVLAARSKESDTGYYLSYSPGGGSYVYVTGSTFSQTGDLTVLYPSTTKEFDNLVGITYTPLNAFGPEFETISLAQAAAGERLALIDNELIGFATVTLNQNGTVTLTNIFRGMLGTAIASHSIGADIWIFKPSWPNIFFETNAAVFNLRLQAFSISGVIPIEDAAVVAVTKNEYKTIPDSPFYSCSRSGTNWTLRFYPRSATLNGAGQISETSYSPMATGLKMAAPGKVRYTLDGGTTFYTTDDFVVTFTSSPSTIQAWSDINGKRSETAVTCSSPADGATNWSANFIATNTVNRIPYGIEHYAGMMDASFVKALSLLKVSSLKDVTLVSLINENYLMFDSVSSKFKNVTYAAMNVVVTTTTI